MQQEQSDADQIIYQGDHFDIQLVKHLMQKPDISQSLTTPEVKTLIASNNHQMSSAAIVAYIFKTFDQIEIFEETCKKIPKGICAAAIQMNEQSYRCEQCGRQTQYHIFCKKCFQSGLHNKVHYGHRFKAKTDRSGCCDCGDLNSIEKSGFCTEHTGQSKCDQKLDFDIQKRLSEVLKWTFHLLFQKCDQVFLHLGLFPCPQQVIPTSTLQQAQDSLLVILNSLCLFISDFCSDKLPLQFAISQILLSPLNQELNHTCNSKLFQETFMKRQNHKCQDTIMTLIWKYAVVMDKHQRILSKFIYSLFVNIDFRKKISVSYLQNISFLCILFSNLQKQPIVTILNLNLIYCQMLGGELTQNLILCPKFSNIRQRCSFLIHIINRQYYGEINNSLSTLSIFQRIRQVVHAQKNENVCFKLIGEVFQLTKITTSYRGLSFEHHKNKIILVSVLLEMFINFVVVIKFKQNNSKQSFQKTISDFIMNLAEEYSKKQKQSENQKTPTKQLHDNSQHNIQDSSQESQKLDQQKQKNVQKLTSKQVQEKQMGSIIFQWYCLPEQCIGVLMTSYYLKFGRDALYKLLDSSTSKANISLLTSKILKGQIGAYTISKSKEVGFPGEYPPKDLYRYFYRHPTRFLQDCSLSILQIIAQTFPQIFVSQISQIQHELLIQLLSDIMTEESSFINFSTKFSNEIKLSKNALKIQLINILNLRNKMTFAEMKKQYLIDMFLDKIEFNHALMEVATFDIKTESYRIKQEYKNFQEIILIKRAQDSFGNFFEQHQSQFKLMQKDNLFAKQIEENWETLCYLTTISIINTPQFMNILQELVSYVWNYKGSSKDFQYVKFIQIILLRNTKNQKLKSIYSKMLILKPQTQIQKLIHNVVGKILNQSTKISKQKVQQKKTQKPNRMKAHLQKLKKQQQQFVLNNVQLFKQNQDMKKQVQQKEQYKCLICQQGKIGDEYPVFVLASQFHEIQKVRYCTYASCGHLFHPKCLNNTHSNYCPVCQHNFDNMFPLIPSAQLHMLNPFQQNKVTCNISDDIFKFHLGTPPISRVIQIIFGRIYFAILDSSIKFVNKDLIQLKPMYAKCAIEEQKHSTINTEDQQKLLRRKQMMWQLQHQNAAEIFSVFIYNLIAVTLNRDSLSIKKLFDEVISEKFTVFFADNFLTFTEGQINDIQLQLKQHADALNAKMNQFCKAIIFVYSVLFDDQRNTVLSTITDEDKIAEILIQKYPDFFTLDQKILSSYLQRFKNNKVYKTKVPESLIPIPQTILLPQNYKQFHKKYYDMVCHQCYEICNFYESELWMCLLCGYKSCLQKCPLAPEVGPMVILFQHFGGYHNQSGLAIQLNTSKISIVESNIFFDYGYLYQNDFGEYDSDEIKKWEQLRLQNNKWSKLLGVLRKRMLRVYALQNHLKGKIFNV